MDSCDSNGPSVLQQRFWAKITKPIVCRGIKLILLSFKIVVSDMWSRITYTSKLTKKMLDHEKKRKDLEDK